MKNIFPTLILLVVLSVTACSMGAPVPPTPTPDPLVVQGQQVFNARCATCHALVPDTIIIGPSLAGVATRAETRVKGQTAEEYLQLSVLRPGDYVVEGFTDIMITNFSKELTNEDMNALMAFLLTLKSHS
ncbi:MAG: cytochrome c [Anaerolineales bacterium]|nr:cytochrome c [Anaerolineales bacterium]